MQQATWYFDFISPYAYLQWRRLQTLGDRLAVRPTPILFAGVLNHWGQKGPAEIPRKREFTYHFVQWYAQRNGIPLRFPPAHPFNPLTVLRLSIATGNTPEAITAIFDHIWAKGEISDTPEALAATAARLGIADVATAIAAPAVKDQLRQNTEAAIAAQVFGVPTLAIADQLFWGNDATDMALDYLRDPQSFATPEMQRLATLPQTAQRR